jgi:hypothetical protein
MKIMADLHDVDKSVIDVVFNQSGAEMQAMADLDMINRGEVPKV